MDDPVTEAPEDIELIPIDQIRVMNPRARDPKRFKQIMRSIGAVGLKRPITVTRRPGTTGEDSVYDLVCGQGRLEAYIQLGETAIPAIVREASKEDRLVMSLVENLARRRPATFDHVVQIARLRDEGYSATVIATKIGLHQTFVSGVLNLWDHGEERLIRGVEQGLMPLSVAIEVARAPDLDAQRVIADLYAATRASTPSQSRRLSPRRLGNA